VICKAAGLRHSRCPVRGSADRGRLHPFGTSSYRLAGGAVLQAQCFAQGTVAAAAKAMLVGAHAGELADDLLQFVPARPVGAMIVEF